MRKDDVAWLWHARFGHIHFRALQNLSHKEMTRGIPYIKHVEELCDGCIIWKQHRTPFPQVTTYLAKNGLELVHCDLCGPITPVIPDGRRYFLLIIDDFSRYMWIGVLTRKEEAFHYFKKIKAAAETKHGCKLRAFCSDRSREFNSGALVELCEEIGTKHNTTTPYSPQQNR